MSAPPPAHPAATLVLLRDRPAGLEVLMLERHADAFFSGALVFPGGRVDAADAAPALLERCRRSAGLDDAALSFRVAAIRESYEETRILLACRVGEDRLIPAGAMAALERRLGAALGRAPHFADLVADGEIELATDRLVPYAHWVTPERSPKRYDTLFFLAPAPADQVPEPDGREAVAVAWVTPALALAEADAMRRRLIFATRMNLARLASDGATVDAVLAAAAGAADRIARICPEVYEAPDGFRIRIPAGLGYAPSDMPTRNPLRG